MTNCVRHAHAKSIRVELAANDDQLVVSVSDDGRGLDAREWRNGLGLRGIEERVKELHGTMTIGRQGARGTIVSARVPLPAAEMPLASAAG
jgi:signal transduction histidine kinase